MALARSLSRVVLRAWEARTRSHCQGARAPAQRKPIRRSVIVKYLAEVVDEPAVEELELYAKVVSVHPGHAGPGGIATSLVFTSLSSSARRALDQARDFAGHPA